MKLIPDYLLLIRQLQIITISSVLQGIFNTANMILKFFDHTRQHYLFQIAF